MWSRRGNEREEEAAVATEATRKIIDESLSLSSVTIDTGEVITF
jgi:hypothetical protein